VAIKPFTPADLYGMFHARERTIPFLMLRVERVSPCQITLLEVMLTYERAIIELDHVCKTYISNIGHRDLIFIPMCSTHQDVSTYEH